MADYIVCLFILAVCLPCQAMAFVCYAGTPDILTKSDCSQQMCVTVVTGPPYPYSVTFSCDTDTNTCKNKTGATTASYVTYNCCNTDSCNDPNLFKASSIAGAAITTTVQPGAAVAGTTTRKSSACDLQAHPLTVAFLLVAAWMVAVSRL